SGASSGAAARDGRGTGRRRQRDAPPGAGARRERQLTTQARTEKSSKRRPRGEHGDGVWISVAAHIAPPCVPGQRTHVPLASQAPAQPPSLPRHDAPSGRRAVQVDPLHWYAGAHGKRSESHVLPSEPSPAATQVSLATSHTRASAASHTWSSLVA